jgi:hypothetical protein
VRKRKVSLLKREDKMTPKRKDQKRQKRETASLLLSRKKGGGKDRKDEGEMERESLLSFPK